MGQQSLGHLAPPGPTHGHQVQQGMGTPNPPDTQAPQAPELQLGGAQIAVQLPGMDQQDPLNTLQLQLRLSA
jgi:hypothetical protein